MHTEQETFDASNLGLIAQGRPGWSVGENRCCYMEGCAAAQFMTPEQREICDNSNDQSAVDHPACEFLANAGHDPDFVAILQNIHDNAAYAAKGDAAEWRKIWLGKIREQAVADGLLMDATLAAARAAGWEISA